MTRNSYESYLEIIIEAFWRFFGASSSISDEHACVGITHNAFHTMNKAFGRFSGASFSLLDERACAKITHNAFHTMTEAFGRFSGT